MTAIPISVITGSVVSTQLLRLDGWLGLAGWQWLFIVEAVPAIILGFVVWLWLTDTPEDASWLRPDQREWLSRRLANERAQREAIRHYALGETLRNPRVWLLTLVYFGQNVSGYGLILFLPQIISKFGASLTETGLVTAIPFVFGGIVMVLWGLHSDRTCERSKHAAASCLVAFVGLAVCIFIHNPIIMMTALVVAQMGQSSIAPTFWTLPTAMLSGTAAAGGIALINAVGNLGGFLGPYLMGVVKNGTGSFSMGLLTIATGSLVGGLVLLALGHDRRLEGAVQPQIGSSLPIGAPVKGASD
jgi:MFS transporter, ACS family, tartrate transporter